MDRRTFVKACVGIAGAGAFAASGVSIAAGLARPRAAGGALLRYVGAHRVAGPAPRGVPYIPLTVENGKFVGKPTIPSIDGTGDINVLEWYKYCGHAGAPGLTPDFTNDNTMSYFIAEEKLRVITPWFKEYIGQAVAPDHFPADNFGAGCVWRSQGQSGSAILTALIVRASDKEIEKIASVVPPAKPLRDNPDEMRWVRENIFHENYIAVSTFCTHFCCIPGYKEAEALARPRDAWDNMFCTCHNSNYNHRQPVAYTFSPEVVAGAEEGGFDPLLTKQQAAGGGH